jgi:hypothetical protein
MWPFACVRLWDDARGVQVKDRPAARSAAPGFVVLRQSAEGHWDFLGDVARKRGVSARAARTQAIIDATNGTAKEGEVYAAVLRSEWRVANGLDATTGIARSWNRDTFRAVHRV